MEHSWPIHDRACVEKAMRTRSRPSTSIEPQVGFWLGQPEEKQKNPERRGKGNRQSLETLSSLPFPSRRAARRLPPSPSLLACSALSPLPPTCAPSFRPPPFCLARALRRVDHRYTAVPDGKEDARRRHHTAARIMATSMLESMELCGCQEGERGRNVFLSM
jgi:hypothetical protein